MKDTQEIKGNYITGEVYSIENDSLEEPTKTEIVIKTKNDGKVKYYSFYTFYEGKTHTITYENNDKGTGLIGRQMIVEYKGKPIKDNGSDRIFEEDEEGFIIEFDNIVSISVN